MRDLRQAELVTATRIEANCGDALGSGGAFPDRLPGRGRRAGAPAIVRLVKQPRRDLALADLGCMAAIDHPLDLGAADAEVLERAVVERAELGNGLPARTPHRVVAAPTACRHGDPGGDKPAEATSGHRQYSNREKNCANQAAKLPRPRLPRLSQNVLLAPFPPLG